MATSIHTEREVEYPTSDGRPMAETDLHRQDMFDVIATLQRYFAADPNTYVTGNLLLFYVEGNRRTHISPDIFVVKGVPKLPPRDHYLLWKEGKSPDIVFEITSKTTRTEDQEKKWEIYRDVLKVPEYFQFDPTEDYLEPSLQGHRLVNGEYVPVAMVAGRLPSEVLGLHLERDGHELRLFDPETRRRLLTEAEELEVAQARSIEDRRLADERGRYADERGRYADERGRYADEQRRLAHERLQLAEEQRQLAEEQRQLAEERLQLVDEATTRAIDAEAAVQRLRAEVERLLREAAESRGG